MELEKNQRSEGQGKVETARLFVPSPSAAGGEFIHCLLAVV
jgi:hypothetical protein